MANFKDSLEYGIGVEHQVLEVLRTKYPSASHVHKYKGYDIWIPEKHKSIEVKCDTMSNDTGNIVIEIEMFGKPSGLMATTSDYWVIYDGTEMICIKPMKIIECIFNLKLVYREFVGNGDTQSKKAFLVPRNILYTYGKSLKDML